MVKRYSHVIGFDDALFERAHQAQVGVMTMLGETEDRVLHEALDDEYRAWGHLRPVDRRLRRGAAR